MNLLAVVAFSCLIACALLLTILSMVTNIFFCFVMKGNSGTVTKMLWLVLHGELQESRWLRITLLVNLTLNSSNCELLEHRWHLSSWYLFPSTSVSLDLSHGSQVTSPLGQKQVTAIVQDSRAADRRRGGQRLPCKVNMRSTTGWERLGGCWSWRVPLLSTSVSSGLRVSFY